MQICFQNNHSSLVTVAIMWWDPDSCGEDGNWATEGWWNLNPGDNVNTGVGTNNRYFCFYAEAEDGAVWGGDYGGIYANSQAFNSCSLIDSTADTGYGAMQIDAGWWFWSYISYTVTLD